MIRESSNFSAEGVVGELDYGYLGECDYVVLVVIFVFVALSVELVVAGLILC